MSICFLQRSDYRQSASATFAAVSFFAPPPAPSGRPPDWGWGQPALFSPPADLPTVKTVSKMVKKPQQSSLWIALSSSPRKAVWSLSWPAYWERQIAVKSGVNRFIRHIVVLSEFHGILLMIILHFGSDLGEWHCHVKIFLICIAAAHSPISPFDNRL